MMSLSKQIPDRKTLRSFGLLVGGIFALIGVWPLVRGDGPRVWALALAAALALPAWVVPMILAWPFRIWMVLGAALGWFNTRVILGGVYYLMMTPISLIMRATGRDSLSLSLSKRESTYRVVKQPRPANHYERMY